MTFDGKCLGLPMVRDRLKGRFQSIKERLGRDLTDDSKKNMSAGAKEILIKSVAQALPTPLRSV